ncbi:MAG: DUF4838 domain-containing protein [Ruminococcaceae bacterium]|nr:DUF4838 domain-containing protein [Oscillospiraceae bacterium]
MTKKQILLWGAFCLLFVTLFASCRKAGAGKPIQVEPQNSAQTAVSPPGSEKKEEKAQGPDCTIVRGDQSSKAVTDAAVELRKKLESLGLTVDLKTDWVKRGEEIVPFPGEIQVGRTNRPESEAMYARMDADPEPFDYLISVGDVMCVSCEDDSAMDAVALFAEEYAKRRADESGYGSKEFERRHEFDRKLVIGGESFVRFSVTSGKSGPEQYAAAELKKYLKKMGLYEGEGASFSLTLDLSLNRDSYAIVPGENGEISVTGGNGRGVIYGAYAFLEHYAGARFFMPGVETLGSGDIAVNEPFVHDMIFEMRQSDWQCGNSDVDWCLKNSINQREIPASKGGNIKYGGFVHTIASLAGTDSKSQPCFSDPEILDTVIASVRAMLERDPSITIVSVSQNDNQNYCTCSKCREIDREEGSHMGSLLRFVNAVAEDIEDDYPDVIIDTLAYQHTRQAPKITKPRDNVCIRLCSIECCFSHPLNDPSCSVNAAFKKDIEDWNQICDRIYIWDYVTCFSYYVETFPNFEVLRENMRFFAEHGVKGMYPEGNYNSPQSGEFGELRCWLLAKLMQDPLMSDETYHAYMDEFLAAYYGEGWTYIREYIDWACALAAKKHMNIWNPMTSVLNVKRSERAEVLARFDECWDKAEELAGDRLDAVKRSRLQWECVRLMFSPDAERARAFLDEIERLNVRWNEWGEMPSNPNLSRSPAEW